MTNIAQAIKVFALDQHVSTDEQLYTFTGQQLRELIQAAVSEAVREIKEELEALCSDLRGEDYDPLESLTPGIRLRLIEREMRSFRQVIVEKSKQVFEIQGAIRKVGSALSNIQQRVVQSDITTKRLDRLDDLLLSRIDPISFSEIGRYLELGSKMPGKKSTRRQAMTKLGHIIESHPDRYIVRKSAHSNQKFVSLVPEYRRHLA